MVNSAVAPTDAGLEVVPSAEDVAPPGTTKKMKTKRVLHFSDGTLELSDSSDDEQTIKKETVAETQVANVNTATLEWLPWFYYQTSHAGNKALAVCDYLGESLANFFGILSPKYEYEIEQYKKMVAEEEERKKEDLEGGWKEQPNDVVLTDQKSDLHPVSKEGLKI